MNQYTRSALVIAGGLGLLLMVGFLLELPFVTNLFPWQSSRLSNIFIASILAASSIPVIWIGLSGEAAAAVGGALDFGLMYTGIGVFTLQLYAQDSSRVPMLIFGLGSFASVALCIFLFFWARRFPFRDQRAMPRVVRLSFAVFALVLIGVGGAMALKTPNIFPWAISAEVSVIYGWIFLGAACYFLYAIFNPQWDNARGQLLGFLAYDLVLIIPFLAHFANVRPEQWFNLAFYIAVLIYSGGLAIYYLFVNPATRFTKLD
ncbi:MAG: hypothetical protein HZC40_12990 [Chloroflexi bacterium]|nr:hypothetical protein [Chloroflexota bacterium]